jgi:O-antigen/teichoic acid export membrane protein
MKKLSLKKNFAWAFVGNSLSALCMWLLLVLLTKLGTAEIVGFYAVSQAICLPINRLFSLQLPIVQVTDARNDYLFGHYYTLRVTTSILAVFVSVTIGLWFYTDEVVYIILMSIGYAVISVRDTFLAVMQKSERMDRVALSRISQGLLSVILFSILFWNSRNLAVAILGLIMARILVGLGYDVPVTKRLLLLSKTSNSSSGFNLLLDRKKLWNLTRIGVPLGMVSWFGVLFTSIPRLVLDKNYTKEQVGYFAAISSLLVVGTMTLAALSQSVSPRLARYYLDNLPAYKRLVGKLIIIALVLGCMAILVSVFLGEHILKFLFKPDYAQHNNIFIWVTVSGAVLFVFTFLNTALNAARQFKIQVPIYGLAALICGLSSLILIPSHGMKGAVWSIMLCYIFGVLSSASYLIFITNKAAKEPSGVSRISFDNENQD